MCYTTQIHDQYMDEYDRMLAKDALVEKEQERRKQVALIKLETIVAPELVEFFGKILIDAYLEGSYDADIIIDTCKLNKSDLRALNDDDQFIYDEMKDAQSHEEAYGYYEECFG